MRLSLFAPLALSALLALALLPLAGCCCAPASCCDPCGIGGSMIVTEDLGSPEGTDAAASSEAPAATEVAEAPEVADAPEAPAVAEEKPAAVPAKPLEGAASPGALIAELQKLEESNDLAIMVPLVLPEQRGMLSFMFGMFAPSMAITMGEAMAGIGADGDPAKAEEAKAKIQKLKEGFGAILKKHGIEADMDDPLGGLQAMGDNPEEALAVFDKMFEGVDHAAFIREAMGFMAEFGDDATGMQVGPSGDEFAFESVEIEIDGDKAVATAENEDKPLHMVKRDGRWYIDFSAMMPAK